MNSYASDQIASGRMVWLDNLRLIVGVLIADLHASFYIAGQPFPDFKTAQHVDPVLFRSVTYVVRAKLFLIISLFLLCQSPDRQFRRYTDIIHEQSKRLLVPFLLWTVFYTFYPLTKANLFGYEGAIWSELTILWQWARYLLLGSARYLLNFLPTLFGVTLLFPLYQFAQRTPWLCFIVFLKHEADIWILGYLQLMDRFPFLLRDVKVLTYAGYGMVPGALVGLIKQGMDNKRLNDCLFFAFTASISLFGLKLTYFFTVIQSGNWQYNYTSAFWAVFLMPIVLFLACMPATLRKWPLFISRLAPYSFGIYLVLLVFMVPLKIWLWQNNMVPAINVYSKFVSNVLATSFTVWMLSTPPFLGWSVGLRLLPIPAFTKQFPMDLR
ncbi:MAG: acyltransferase [Rhodobacteraceae bacterium]|nr:acyltransferase [Paracoccaceae bacterium]